MKKILTSLIVLVALASCQSTSDNKKESTEIANNTAVTYYGEKITADGAVPTDSLKSLMGDKTELACKLTGTIDAVCQKKGCWMELKNADGSALRVTFKDYAFFMPKDGAGKTAIIDGIAKIEVTSVADLQEYAKDDGQSAADIAKITEPEQELVFEAKGVILQ